MKRALVTGASGFVGRALVAELLRRGVAVTAAVRRTENLPRELAPATLAVVGEIGPGTAWREALRDVDAAFHLAALAHSAIAEDAETAARYRALNVAGTRTLAEQAASAGVRRLVFLSSVKVNGERTDGHAPFSELDAPAPQDIYGRSKREAEQALADVGSARGLETVVLRSPLVHGPGVGGNLNSLLKLCDSPWPLPFGAADNRRSLVARTNLVDALILAGEHPAAAGETYLVRDGDDLSTAELIRVLRGALGRPARLVPVPPATLAGLLRLAGRNGLAQRLFGSLQIDDGRIRQRLGWRPPMTAAAGLAEMARAFAAMRAP